MSYKPFTTDYTLQVIDDIKEYLKETNKDQITLDTLDLCHLIGEIERLKKYEKFIDKVIITPVDWNNEDGTYQLHNMSKQELYKKLFDLRHTLQHEMYDSKVFGSDKT